MTNTSAAVSLDIFLQLLRFHQVSRKKTLGITSKGLSYGQMLFLLPNRQCQGTKETQNALKPTTENHPLHLIFSWSTDFSGKDVVPLRSAFFLKHWSNANHVPFTNLSNQILIYSYQATAKVCTNFCLPAIWQVFYLFGNSNMVTNNANSSWTTIMLDCQSERTDIHFSCHHGSTGCHTLALHMPQKLVQKSLLANENFREKLLQQNEHTGNL